MTFSRVDNCFPLFPLIALYFLISLLQKQGFSNLLGRTPHKRTSIQDGVQLIVNWSKVFTFPDPVNQIIVTTLLLDNRPRLLGQNADLLVTLLSDAKVKRIFILD